MSANPHANGGLLRRSLDLPGLHDHAVAVARPGAVKAESTRVMGKFLRGVIELNDGSKNFRIVGPDETASNRLQDVFEV
ncbi:MAG: phosphoketolase, partial [Mesorhizobium sp.]